MSKGGIQLVSFTHDFKFEAPDGAGSQSPAPVKTHSGPEMLPYGTGRRIRERRQEQVLILMLKSETFSAVVFAYCQKCLIFVSRFYER